MALPTTNLTLHLDASDTDKLFTTWVDGGSHTGTPADGNEVQAWKRETDGSVTPVDAAFRDFGAEYRSTTPLMLLPCLDFADTLDCYRITDGGGISSAYGTGSFMGTQAKTILVAIYPEEITSTAAAAEDNHGVFTFGVCGITLKNDGGTKKALFKIDDGASKVVEVTVTTGATYVLCARHDGTNIYLSVDGGTEQSLACGATAGWPIGDMNIGRSDGGVRGGFRMGEFALYNAALTGSDLTDAVAYFRQKWQGVGGAQSSSRNGIALSAISAINGITKSGISAINGLTI